MSSAVVESGPTTPPPPPYKRHHLEQPRPHRTKPLAWLMAVICAVLWALIALGGLAILVVYLVFRPKIPRLEISTATLNAAYVDTGNLLNVDVTLLANFTNPNHKVDVSYRDISIDLFYNGTMIATQAIGSFDERREESDIKDVHLVSSWVELPPGVADWLRNRLVRGHSVGFDVIGTFLTRSSFGGLARVTYWLHARCSVVVSAPPIGVLLSSQCTTKR